MLVGRKLLLLSQGGERLALPHSGVIHQQVNYFRREHEEATIDHPPTQGFFLESSDAVISANFERAETARGIGGSLSGERTLVTVESDQWGYVDVSHTIAIGETEGVVLGQVIGNSLEPTTSHGLLAGIDQPHLPRFGMVLVNLHAVICHVEDDIRHVQEVVGDVFLFR